MLQRIRFILSAFSFLILQGACLSYGMDKQKEKAVTLLDIKRLQSVGWKWNPKNNTLYHGANGSLEEVKKQLDNTKKQYLYTSYHRDVNQSEVNDMEEQIENGCRDLEMVKKMNQSLQTHDGLEDDWEMIK